jgi:predicted phosphodiesterase
VGLGKYVYPRYAVHISSGQAVSIERLRARCLWYPAVGLDGRMVSGHVLYISQVLNEVMELALGMHNIFDWNAEGEAEGGEEGIAHRLAPPIRANAHASVQSLIRAVVDHTKQALPPSKRKLLSPLAQVSPKETLLRLEEMLQQHGLHVLLPLYIGNQYQLFTDATEALRPVSPLTLRRTPRLCFVLLSTDTLKNERRDSPWLREAAELMALPINVVYTPEVIRFIDELPALRPAQNDSQLMAELLSTLHEITGGWPDLCDRFYEMLSDLADVPALRQRLRQLAVLLRSAELDPTRSKELLELAFARQASLPDLGNPTNFEGLATLLSEPAEFSWEDHGRGYLDGFIGWERGLAVPRSRAAELMVRLSVAKQRQTASASGSFTPLDPRAFLNPVEPAATQTSSTPGPHTVRWLHVSDFHFSDKHHAQGAGIVLESLLNTLTDMRRHPRWRGIDVVFVTGDIAQAGSEAEYRLAEEFLGRLCQTLSLPRAAVFMVPGNHDVFRPRGAQLVRTLSSYEDAQAYFQPSAERLHLRKMEAFVGFYNRFYAGDKGGSPAVAPRQAATGLATAEAELYRVRDVTLGILPLNTGLFAQDDSDTGKLFVGEPLLREGLKRLAGASLRLALMHHPLADLSDVERRPVQELLQENCHFILRGHLHDNEAGYISSAYKQTLVLAAGAAYHGRVAVQNRALIVEAEVDQITHQCRVSPYPIRYEYGGHDRWTLDTGVFPKSYPTYLEVLTLGI